MLLLDLFVSQNKLTELEAKDIESDLALRDDVLVDTLLLDKHITADEITEVRSVLYGLPIYKDEIPEGKELTKYISVVQSKQLSAVPPALTHEALFIAAVDPEHANVLDSLQFLFGTDHQAYKVHLITYDAYKKHFGMSDAKDDKASLTTKVDDTKLSYISKDETGDKKDGQSGDDIDLTDVTGMLDEGLAKLNIPDIFSTILRYAIDNGASDIHIEHTGTGVRARVRLDGQLETITTLPVKMHPMLVARIKILCSIKLDEKRKPQDGRFSTKFGDHTIDYRVSTFPGYTYFG